MPTHIRTTAARRTIVTSFVLVVVIVTSCSEPTGPGGASRERVSADVVPPPAPTILIGAGDIAGCSTTWDDKTAAILDSVVGSNPTATVFVAGDNVYNGGTAVEYENCYGPNWGRHKGRTRPSLGNHEYETGVVAPSFDYFGDAAWGNSRARGGYYSYDLGKSWHVVVLNSNTGFVPAAAGSPQDQWLKADLAANSRPCVAAVWHHPRFYSSTDATSGLVRSAVLPFWQALYAAGADVVLNGHSHTYERFAPLTPTGVVDQQKGIRQFIVGTGGKSISAMTKIHPASEVRNGSAYGVLQLTLGDGSYSWQFLPIAGKTFSDTGSSTCHKSAPPPPTNAPPTAAFTASCTGLNCAFTDGSTDADGAIASRSWSFGDGSAASTETNPSHAYATGGSYVATLTVTDDKGATASVSRNVVTTAGDVPPGNSPPRAEFTATCTELNCGFTDASSDTDGSVMSWTWNFGDGSSSSAQSPSHAYAQAGLYTATLTATDDKGATATVSHAVSPAVTPSNAPPTAGFTASCTGLGCSFTDASADQDGSVASRSWNFGDGTSSTAQSPSHSYVAGGAYAVTLTVTDDKGATGTVTRTVTVTPPAPANVAPSAYFGSSCAKLSCTFTDRSKDADGTVVAWQWSFADGTSSTVRSPTHVYKAGATYKVKLTIRDDKGAAGSITHSVTVAP